MVVLAVTGGIGSGKSFVTRILSAMGYPVFDTDSVTKQLYSDSPDLRSSLRGILGDSVFFPDGTLNRKAMASMVFTDSILLSEVENAVYPVLADSLGAWIDKCLHSGTDIAVVESALILEKEIFHSMVDRILTVSAPEELRISRAVKRDGTDRSGVEERMKHQNSDVWREECADFIVINDGRPLLPQLVKVIDKLKYGDES